MNIGKTLFAQLMDFLPWSTFNRIVERHGGDGIWKVGADGTAQGRSEMGNSDARRCGVGLAILLAAGSIGAVEFNSSFNRVPLIDAGAMMRPLAQLECRIAYGVAEYELSTAK